MSTRTERGNAARVRGAVALQPILGQSDRKGNEFIHSARTVHKNVIALIAVA
jgi:hypothetical protein